MSVPTPPDHQRLLRQQETLRAIIEEISSELELRPLLTTIVRHACDLLGADRGSIGLVDEERRVVRTEAVHRMPTGELGAEMPEGVGLAGRVLAEGKTIVQGRYGDLDRPTLDTVADNTVVGMPIAWRGEMIGFFGIGADPPHRFSDEDVALLTLLSRHAATAITNAQLFEREKRRAARVATVSRVGRLITSSLSLDEILQTAVESIREQLDYSSVDIFLSEPHDPDALRLRSRSGLEVDPATGGRRWPLSRGVVGRAAREQRAIYVPEVRLDADYVPFPGGENLRSELALPIAVGERLLGVLNVESEERIHDEDRVGLTIVADQLGVAVENARLFAATEASLHEMQLLLETSQRIGMAMDVEGVVDAYLEQVAARRRYSCSVVMFSHDEVGDKREIVILGRWSPQGGLTKPNARFPYFHDHFDEVLDAGLTVTIADTESDPRVSDTLRRAQREAGRPALALIPLMVSGRRIGLVSLNHPRAHAWSDDDLRPYQVTAAQLATALGSRAEQRRVLERDQQMAVLEERQRLARELHDSVSQLIFSMTLIAQSIGPAWARDPSEGEARVARLLELSQAARSEMRALLIELRPSERPSGEVAAPPTTAQTPADRPLPGGVRVRLHGLVAALEHHLADLGRDGLTATLDADGYRAGADPDEEALYRIAQEGLANVLKHAGASHVRVTLWSDDTRTGLRVADDGRGFDPADGDRRGHFGLHTMRERAEALGGSFHLASTPGRGTTVEVRIPRGPVPDDPSPEETLSKEGD